MSNQKQSPLTTTLLLIAFAALAIFLRLRHIDTTAIWSDQSFTMNTAMRWVNGGALPLASNKSSVGFINPPMVEYVYGVALKIWPDVLSGALITMLLGLGAIVVTYWATAKQFGRKPALYAAALFVVNPWLVYYSQLIWNQTLVPFFAAATFCLLWLYVTHENKAWYLIGSCIAASCMTQVHPGSVVQLVAMTLILLIHWRKWRIWHLLLGGLAFVVLYIPFLLYEVSVEWIDIKTILALSGEPAALSWASFLVSLDLVQAQGVSQTVFNSTHTVDSALRVVFSLALLFVVGRWVLAVIKRGDSAENALAHKILPLLIWFIVPVLTYLRPSFHLQIYYLLGQIPVHFIILGFALNYLSKRMGKISWLVPLAVLGIMLWQSAFTLAYQNERAANNRFQIRHARAAISEINTLLADNPDCKLTVISDGYSVEVSDLSLLTSFTNPDRLLITDGDLAIPTPQPCALYLDTVDDRLASNWVKQNGEVLSVGDSAELKQNWQFYRISQFAPQPNPPLAKADRTFNNGLRLTNFTHSDTLEPNQTFPLTLQWALDQATPEERLHFGTYLLTENNEVVAQFDGPGFDSIQWRQGDAFITWFNLQLPADLPNGTYKLAVALYGWPDLSRMSLENGDNTLFFNTISVQN